MHDAVLMAYKPWESFNSTFDSSLGSNYTKTFLCQEVPYIANEASLFYHGRYDERIVNQTIPLENKQLFSVRLAQHS